MSETIASEIIVSETITSEAIVPDVLGGTAKDKNSSAGLSLANAVVLDYCTAVKGILNDDQGGPLHPPGLRMALALQSVRESVERCLATKKGALRNGR